MLASLLPGLRDIRTPLTVGYLWLLATWLILGDQFKKEPVSRNGLVSHLFTLEGFLGKAFVVTALAFTAYLLGAILTVALENRFVARALNTVGSYPRDNRLTTFEFLRWRLDQVSSFEMRLAQSGLSSEAKSAYEEDLERLGLGSRRSPRDNVSFYDLATSNLAINDLRARLLVANQDMYGEYDRLAAEANFRVNVFLPLMALALIIIFKLNIYLGIGVVVGAAILLIQGANRLSLSTTVLRRAVLSNVIKDPVIDKLNELDQRLVSGAGPS
jgi:hypothetical protein